jgi:ABC transporter transmembrane region 2
MTAQRKWREWLSKHLIDYWLTNGRYRRLKFTRGEHRNPEYRIAEDARVATDSPIDLAWAGAMPSTRNRHFRNYPLTGPVADIAKATRIPSRPGEFHPEPLTDPDLILSHHPARATARRLPPSVELRVPPVGG